MIGYYGDGASVEWGGKGGICDVLLAAAFYRGAYEDSDPLEAFHAAKRDPASNTTGTPIKRLVFFRHTLSFYLEFRGVPTVF